MADPVLIQTSLARDPSMVALATVAARISAVDVDAATVMDAGRVAASALDHMADRFGILGSVAWSRAASDAERRDLIRRALRTQLLKGTRAGVEEAARAAGAEVVQVTTPPARMYLGGAMTDAQRARWLSRHAQLRIYRERNRGVAADGAAYVGRTYLSGDYAPVLSDAPLLARPRVYLYRKGVETELTALEVVDQARAVKALRPIEIRDQGSAAGATVAGRDALGHSYLGRDGARTYRVDLTAPYTERTRKWTRLERPSGLEFVSIRYDAVSERYSARGVYPGDFLRDLYLNDDSARDHVYRRFWLVDPDAPLEAQPSEAYVGGNMGMPRHTAKIRLRIPLRATGIYLGDGAVGEGLTRPDMRPFQDALRAQVEMMRATDRLRISTVTRERLMARSSLVAGRFLAGQYVPVY